MIVPITVWTLFPIVRRFFSTKTKTVVGHKNFSSLIGNTPLLKLNYLQDLLPKNTHIYVKCEFMNPGGSVKDRAAKFIIEEAEKNGLLKPGMTVVEGTAGNTGIGLAHICHSKGYPLIIYMPNTQSIEKINTLKALGAKVITVPAVPYSDPNMYQHQAKREAERIGGFHSNQFDNIDNRLAHYKTTGPEIWKQTNGEVDGFVCATGTGGTLGGISRYLKEQNSNVKVFLADPTGSCLYSWVKTGKLERTGDGSITEGIANGRITSNLEGTPIDDAILVTDDKVISTLFDLLYNEGLYVGTSSALNVVAAIEMAKKLGPNKTVVSILCDDAGRYQSRLFSKKWLESKNLLQHIPEKYQENLNE